MKPERATYLVAYWRCAFPNHHHRLESAAAACIAREQRTRGRQPNTWNHDTRAVLLREFSAGETMSTLGKKYGVSGGRIRQVLWRAFREATPGIGYRERDVEWEKLKAARGKARP